MKQMILTAIGILFASNVFASGFTCPTTVQYADVFNTHPWGSTVTIEGVNFMIIGGGGSPEKLDPKNLNFRDAIMAQDHGAGLKNGIGCNYLYKGRWYGLDSVNNMEIEPASSNWDKQEIPGTIRYICHESPGSCIASIK